MSSAVRRLIAKMPRPDLERLAVGLVGVAMFDLSLPDRVMLAIPYVKDHVRDDVEFALSFLDEAATEHSNDRIQSN